MTATQQAPPSLWFFRQEHRSGLLFPSPVHETEKWKWSRSVASHSQWLHGLQPTRLFHPWDFSRQEYWSGVPLLGSPSAYLFYNWKFVSFDHLHPICLHSPTSDYHISDLFLSLFWYIIYLNYVSFCFTAGYIFIDHIPTPYISYL